MCFTLTNSSEKKLLRLHGSKTDEYNAVFILKMFPESKAFFVYHAVGVQVFRKEAGNGFIHSFCLFEFT